VKTDITIIKRNHIGAEVVRYAGKVLRRSQDEILIEAAFSLETGMLVDVPIRRGDRFLETYYAKYWYNIYEIRDKEDGNLKGWYCNVTRPAYLGEVDIYAEDLALDVVVSPEGTIRLLDEDEYASLEISEAERHEVRRAVAELRDLAQRGAAPFGAGAAP